MIYSCSKRLRKLFITALSRMIEIIPNNFISFSIILNPNNSLNVPNCSQSSHIVLNYSFTSPVRFQNVQKSPVIVAHCMHYISYPIPSGIIARCLTLLLFVPYHSSLFGLFMVVSNHSKSFQIDQKYCVRVWNIPYYPQLSEIGRKSFKVVIHSIISIRA